MANISGHEKVRARRANESRAARTSYDVSLHPAAVPASAWLSAQEGGARESAAASYETDFRLCSGEEGMASAGERTATRHGSEHGSVTLGGRRTPVVRPRMRAADGSGEVPVGAYELFNSTELLGKMAMEKMLAGLSTRRRGVGLEPVR